jgi:hypothetical protein
MNRWEKNTNVISVHQHTEVGEVFCAFNEALRHEVMWGKLNLEVINKLDV